MGVVLVFWRVVLAVAVLVVSYASLSPASGDELFVGVDKIAHCITYACLYIVAWLAFPGPVLRWAIHLGLLAFGVSIELLQYSTGYRFMEGADVLANISGAGIGNLLLSLYITRWPGRYFAFTVRREKKL
ncbi:MAG: hypothetical protein DRR06_01590 [Gammaproteobacteria bacterium]|nr:MAG: hypothetical protein DRR06_01590 [Gammaproteobacteria bacterium]RLA54558.1 MAG: hypothetical protein DRR42_01305 [Gammaproteobacteria bacterium]